MAKNDKPLFVRGIKINADKSVLDDFEFTELLADSQSDDAMTQIKAVVGMFRFVFKEDWESVRDEVRKQNGGKLTNEDATNFFGEVMEALQAKN